MSDQSRSATAKRGARVAFWKNGATGRWFWAGALGRPEQWRQVWV